MFYMKLYLNITCIIIYVILFRFLFWLNYTLCFIHITVIFIYRLNYTPSIFTHSALVSTPDRYLERAMKTEASRRFRFHRCRFHVLYLKQEVVFCNIDVWDRGSFHVHVTHGRRARHMPSFQLYGVVRRRAACT